MQDYEYECWVEGPWSGTISANNIIDATEKAQYEIFCEGLSIVENKINVYPSE